MESTEQDPVLKQGLDNALRLGEVEKGCSGEKG